MNNVTKKYLSSSETIIARGNVHWVIFVFSTILFVSGIVLVLYPGQVRQFLIGILQRNISVTLFADSAYNLIWVMHLTGLALIGLGLIRLTRNVIFYWSTTLILTNEKILTKLGAIRRSIVEMAYERVESVVVKQSLLGRVFNYGTIYIKGIGGGIAPIPMITNPMEFRKTVQKAINNI